MATVRCADWWERKHKGMRYVMARGQCKRTTAHPSGYCKAHRHSWRWSEAQELDYLNRRCRSCGTFVGPRGGCPVNRKDCGR